MGFQLRTAAVVFALAAATVSLATQATADPAKRCRASRIKALEGSGFLIRMVVSNEGGGCDANLDFERTGWISRSNVIPTNGSVTTLPKHGTAILQFTPKDAAVEYTPERGYTGTDRFEMRLVPNTYPWTVEVTIAP